MLAGIQWGREGFGWVVQAKIGRPETSITLDFRTTSNIARSHFEAEAK